jgi:DnaJ-class molecular chaperone
MPNYYEILGVENTANDLEIKKAYKMLSLIHHPDRGGDTTKFQEINTAYETLKDSERRSQYDAELNGIHMNPFGAGFPFQGFPGGANIHFAHGGPADLRDINSFINMMFNNGGMGGMPNMQIGKPVPIIKNVKITIEQAYSGVSIPVEIERWIIRDNIKNMEKENVYVQFPPGIDDNEIIILRERGNVVNENVKGDIKIVVQIENNTMFQRHGLDLVYSKTITLKEALCGFQFSIVHLNGKQLSFNNTVHNTIIKPNSKKVIPSMGITRENNTGNLIIDFNIEFPDTLTQEQIRSLSSIL